MDAYPDTAQALLASPLTLLPVLKAAIIESQLQLRSILTLPSTASVKRSPIVRFHHLPPIPTLLRPYLSALKAEDTQRLLQVHGTVVKTNAVKMLEVSRIYTCLRNHCDHRFKVTADPEQDHLMEQPLSCPVLLDPVLGPVCGSKSVREIEGTKECIDYQEIRIQDRMDALPFGALPRSLNVILESDLVDSLNPGDDVEVIGVLYRQWKPVRIGVKCEATLAFKAFGVRVLNQFNSFRLYKSVQECKENFNLFWERLQDNKVAGRDALVRLVCPQLYGLYFVKLAVLLTVLGGSATVKSEGVQSRSNCHILLVIALFSILYFKF